MSVPTYSHHYARLYHRGLRGFERAARAERRYQIALCLLLTAGLVAALCAVAGV